MYYSPELMCIINYCLLFCVCQAIINETRLTFIRHEDRIQHGSNHPDGLFPAGVESSCSHARQFTFLFSTF